MTGRSMTSKKKIFPSKESSYDFLMALVPVVRELSIGEVRESSIREYSFDSVVGLIVANIKIMKAQHDLLKKENARLRRKVEELSQLSFWSGGKS
jgi:hypothetical protein